MKLRGVFATLLIVSSVVSQPVRAEYYDLERALEVAMKVSTSVGISFEQLQSQRTRVLASYGNWMPNLNANLYVGHTYIGPTTIAVDAQGRQIDQTGTDFNNYRFSVNSGMTLFDWGANLNRLYESKNGAQAAGYDLEYQKDFITAVVIREYYDLVKQRRLRIVQEDDLEAKTRNLEQVEAFYKIGSRTRADFLQARVDRANSELILLNAVNSEQIADVRLKHRLNLGLATTLEVEEVSEVVAAVVDIDSEVQFMMSHRSDLLAGRYRVDAAMNGLKASQRALYPTAAANFSFSWSDREWPDNSSFFNQDYNWGVGVFLNWDIFDRFQTKANVQNARAQHRIAEYNLQQAKLDAILDVQQIVLNLAQATERLELATETVEQAEENMRLAEERYRVGAGTVLETIEATASMTRAQASLIEAQIDFLVNRADLKRATGRRVSSD